MKVMIVAKPGHYRDSLVALLKTRPQFEVALEDIDPYAVSDLSPRSFPAETPATLSDEDSAIIVVDGDAFGQSIAHSLKQFKCQWPESRYVVLVDNYRQMNRMKAYGADYVLYKSISIGEFLSTVENAAVPTHRLRSPEAVYTAL